ncbi:MAG: chemotaxis protein CheW [Nitrospirota bacterium]|nr:chemotaxis protein CheW [Nitrospirota bacterium]
MVENIENSGTPEEEYGTPELKACIFSVGGQEFSVDMAYLKGIAELSEIVPLPLSPSYIEGITSLRGMAVPVVNLATLKELHEEKAA